MCAIDDARHLSPLCSIYLSARLSLESGNVLDFNAVCFVVSGALQIRVVNAFRQGLDARYGEHSNTSLAEVLRKQTSLSKRLSQTSSIEYADNIPDELTIPEIDVERLSSHSHTETAV